jgi:hypothetical protein
MRAHHTTGIFVFDCRKFGENEVLANVVAGSVISNVQVSITRFGS